MVVKYKYGLLPPVLWIVRVHEKKKKKKKQQQQQQPIE